MKPSHLVVVLASSFSIGGLSGCSRTADPPDLPELPQQESAKLEPVPNTGLLATKVKPSIPALPGGGRATAACPGDHLTSFYEAQITTPITVCSLNVPTLQLFDRGPSSKRRFSHAIADRLYTCSVQNGPWTAQITSERMCVVTCSPLNSLMVVGVPNTVQFQWFGGIEEDHPAGFEFVSSPTLVSTTSFPCHQFGPPAPAPGSSQ